MPVNPKDVVNARRAEVARRYLRGETQAEIAAAVNFTQQQVSHDLKKIREEWKASRVRDFDEVQAEQLAKIDQLESAYWAEWERSKTPLKREQVKRTGAKAKDGEKTATTAIEQTNSTTERVGDPRFLDGIQRCIEQRVKLLGLAAPTKLQHSGPGGGPLGPVTLVAEIAGSRSELLNAPPVPPPPPRQTEKQ